MPTYSFKKEYKASKKNEKKLVEAFNNTTRVNKNKNVK